MAQSLAERFRAARLAFEAGMQMGCTPRAAAAQLRWQESDRRLRARKAMMDTSARPCRDARGRAARRTDSVVAAGRHGVNPQRLQIIREAAESLASRPRAAHEARAEARPVFGCRQQARAAMPIGWVEQRHARINEAIAFLNTKGRGVQIIDRDARVRKYRLTGKVEPMLAEEIIRYAVAQGFEPDGGGNGAA